MANNRLTCENCGFEEELSNKQVKARVQNDGAIACSACGEQLPLPEDFKTPGPKKAKPVKKSKYSDLDDMTGLDDVIEDEFNENGDSVTANEQENTLEEAADGAPSPAAADAQQDGDSGQDGSGNAGASAANEKSASPEAASYAGDNAEARPDNDSAKLGAAREAAGHAAEAAREKLKKTVQYGKENPLFAAEIISCCFKKIADGADGRFDKIANVSVRTGHCVLLGTAALAVIMGVLVSLRSLSLSPLFTGITLAAALLFAQYLALKGFALLEGYIEENPSRLPGPALPEILSAASVLFALLSLISGLAVTISYYSPVWMGFASLAVIIGYFVAASFMSCRSRLNVSYDENMPASEVIIEIVLTQLKALVAVTPFIFGLGSAALALFMIWPVVSMMIFGLNPINTTSFFMQQAGILFCAFAPIAIYVFILLWTFVIQVARNLLNMNK